MFDFSNYFDNELKQLKIIDIGAMGIEGHQNVYDSLLKYENCHVIGFEPIESECEKLNKKSTKKHSYLPYFIGDGSERYFYLCNSNMTSSLYPPNTQLLNKFQNLAELCIVKDKSLVSTKRLDDIEEVKGADFIKIDVQGSELDVFKGATNFLKDVLVIHTEVEFLPLYIDQPLFVDIDQYLRNRGFQFHKIDKVAGRTLKPLIANNNINYAMSQQLWADAVYIKDILHLDKLTNSKLIKFAIIMHTVYNAYDFAHYALQQYDRNNKSEWAKVYLESMLGKTEND